MASLIFTMPWVDSDTPQSPKLKGTIFLRDDRISLKEWDAAYNSRLQSVNPHVCVLAGRLLERGDWKRLNLRIDLSLDPKPDSSNSAPFGDLILRQRKMMVLLL